MLGTRHENEQNGEMSVLMHCTVLYSEEERNALQGAEGEISPNCLSNKSYNRVYYISIMKYTMKVSLIIVCCVQPVTRNILNTTNEANTKLHNNNKNNNNCIIVFK